MLDSDLHLTPVRLAARLLDPERSSSVSAMLKTHNTVVATLSVKNMALGAPLHFAPKERPRWNDKRKYHGGVRQTHFDIMLTAQKLRPFWGATLIDGYEGMEGNGPGSGTPVPSRVAIASTDYIAADRVGVEAMGIDPRWIGLSVVLLAERARAVRSRRSTSRARTLPRCGGSTGCTTISTASCSGWGRCSICRRSWGSHCGAGPRPAAGASPALETIHVANLGDRRRSHIEFGLVSRVHPAEL